MTEREIFEVWLDSPDGQNVSDADEAWSVWKAALAQHDHEIEQLTCALELVNEAANRAENLRQEIAAQPQPQFPHCGQCGSSAWVCSVCAPAQPAAQQEPVAWISERNDLQLKMGDKPGANWRPLYAAAQRKPMFSDLIGEEHAAIEAAHNIK